MHEKLNFTKQAQMRSGNKYLPVFQFIESQVVLDPSLSYVQACKLLNSYYSNYFDTVNGTGRKASGSPKMPPLILGPGLGRDLCIKGCLAERGVANTKPLD